MDDPRRRAIVAESGKAWEGARGLGPIKKKRVRVTHADQGDPPGVRPTNEGMKKDRDRSALLAYQRHTAFQIGLKTAA